MERSFSPGNERDPVSSFVALPKAEVHVHLEGCFEVADIVRLAKQNGEDLPRPEADLLSFAGLADFLAFLDWVCGLVRSRDQLAGIAYDFSRRMRASGVLYADPIVNPTHWRHWRHDLAGMIDGLDAGFRAAEQDGLRSAKLCISLLRQQSAEEAMELVGTLGALRHPRVVALSIDGNEAAAGRTGARFADAFKRAGDLGLRRTVHAGESSGPEGVWDAVEMLGADRIDHGVRAVEDPALVEHLAQRRIPLGICPSSNVSLGLYERLEQHPIDRLRRAGVPVSINTDDPALLRLSLPDEYARTAEAFGWDRDTVREIAANSIQASFAYPSLTASIMADLVAW